MSGLKVLLKEIENLKPIPQIAHQIMAITENPKSSMTEIAEVIQYDPLITANLLRICNSAYFSFPRKIESLHDAINILGLDRITDLVLMKCGAENLKKGQEGYGLHEGELWRHSISSALIARDLAEKKKVPNKQMVFTAALLQDIGKVILDRYVAGSFNKILDLVQKHAMSFREAEKQVIGIDHAELGAMTAKMWGFSPKMIHIIRHHHLSDVEARKDIETCIVYVADTICMMMGVGIGVDGLAYRFYDDVLKNLEITPVDIQEIIAVFGENMQKVEALITSV